MSKSKGRICGNWNKNYAQQRLNFITVLGQTSMDCVFL